MFRRLSSLFLVACLVLVPASLKAQDSDCQTRLKGNDKSDFDKGVTAYNNKRYQQCLSLMRKVSQHNRTAPDPYFYMGVSAVKTGERPATVRSHFNNLFKYCPDYPNALAYFYLGIVDYTYKNYDDAIVHLNRYFDIANQQPNHDYDAVYEEASSYLYWSEFLSQALLNQVPFFPTVVKGASSHNDEFLPYLSPDGSQLYYLRQVTVSSPGSFYTKETESKVMQLFCSTRNDTAFTAGRPLPAPFNVSGNEGSVTLTADNNTLYYSVMQNNKGYDNCDIYYTRRVDGNWQPLQNAGRNVNGEHTWESQPSISPDGQYLYFASNRDGGLGGTDIWLCRRLPNGDWSRAENLGPAVNTPGNEKCPFIHPDGKTLYFASNGWQGFGGYDMFFIDITDTYLQRPTNLGLPVNSENDDICFGVSADGKRAYFAGKSTEWKGIGGSDIFSFELYPAAQPDEMAIVKACLRNTQGAPLQGTVDVIRHKSNTDHYIVDQNNGHFALALEAKGNNTVILNVDGYIPRVASGNARQLQRDLNTNDFALQPAKLLDRYPLPLTKKDFNDLDAKSSPVLDAYADFLLQHPRMHIRIEATLLEQAKAIHDYFLSRQLRPERFEYKAIPALARPQIVITEL